MRDLKKLNPLYFLFVGATGIQTLFFFYFAKDLRPIADDYCMAYYAGLGFWDSFQTWYTTRISDIVAILANYYLVGFPLLILPYTLASVITLFFAILMISILISYLIIGRIYYKNFLIFFSITTVAYLSFWTSNTFFSDGVDYIKFKNMALHWQNINSQYIFLSALMSLILVKILKNVKTSKFNSVLILLLGFLSGTFGLLIVLTAISLLILFAIYAAIKKETNKFSRILIFASGLVPGFLFSFLSPGNQARSRQLGNEDLSSKLDYFYLFNWTFPKALIEWVDGFLQIGSLMVLVFGIILGIFSDHFNSKLAKYNYFENILIFFSLSVISSFLSQLSEAFAYEAFWHLAVPYLYIFVFLFIFGFYVGEKLKVTSFDINGFALAASLGLILGLSGLSIYKASNEIVERKHLWQSGPAPLLGMLDIENKEDWVFYCWMGVKELKGYPNRENF